MPPERDLPFLDFLVINPGQRNALSKGFRVRRQECQLDSGVTCLQWNENASSDTMIWVGCVGGEIYQVDARNGQTETRLFGHTDSILSLSLSKDGNTLLTSANDCKARVFRLDGRPSTTTTTTT